MVPSQIAGKTHASLSLVNAVCPAVFDYVGQSEKNVAAYHSFRSRLEIISLTGITALVLDLCKKSNDSRTTFALDFCDFQVCLSPRHSDD